jgi:FkbM family methyltransferase
MKFYSQCGEDKIIYEKYFKDKKDGFFIELGAVDGLEFTNTKFFEDELGWSGILIEPQTNMFDMIAINRPKCKAYNFAITDKEGPLTMLVNNNTNPVAAAVSSLENNIVPAFQNRFGLTQKILVNTAKFSDILKENNITKVDFMSLDVEGSEYDVLMTWDWNVPISVILMETLAEFESVSVQCRELLKSKGYIYDGFCPNENELWIHPSFVKI